MFLVLSRYELACKYRIISQISMYNWMQNYIFQYLWYCILIFLRTNYNLLWQVGWFFTWWVEGIITSSDSSLTQNIIRETIKVGEKKGWIFFLSEFSFTNIHESQDCRGKGKGISLTPHYHFQPLHRHLDISWAITAESSPLHKASSRSRTRNLWFSSSSR